MRTLRSLSGLVVAASLVLAGCEQPVQPVDDTAADKPELSAVSDYARLGLTPADPAALSERQVRPQFSATGSSASLTFFSDRASFDANFPDLPLEDFEEANVPARGLRICVNPVDENSNDACFAPGDILPGVRFTAIMPNGNPRPSNAILTLGPGFFNNPSKLLNTNFFADRMFVDFTAGDVTAAGIDLHSFFAQGTCQIAIFGASGLLGSTTASCTNAGSFFGVRSSEVITRIDIFAPFSGAEGVDNVAFGPADIPFAEFVIEEAELELDDDDDPNDDDDEDDDDEDDEDNDAPDDEFEVEGHFVLGDDSDGILVLNEDVTVVFGTFSHTISAGLFVRDDDDEGSEFDGTLPDGTRLKVEIDDDGEFEVEGEDLDLSGNDPNGSVFFSLQIGDDIGETTITFDDGEFELDDEDDDE